MSSSIITFLSVFLGLISGPQEIEVSVDDQVARVEVLVNGELVGQLERAPWQMVHDFGPRLVPHRLEAVAYDDSDSELTRIVQWVNLARSVVQAGLVIERDPDGTAHAQLTWANPLRLEVQSLGLWMDGRELPISDPEHIELPPHDLNQLHFLRAEIEFNDNLSAIAEVTFGGAYADDVSTELTAVPIVLEDEAKLPDSSTLQTWFLVNGKPARVAGVEEGPAEIVMIRDQEAQRTLSSRVPGERGAATERYAGRLKKDQKLAFMWPYMEPNEKGINAFPPLFGWLDPKYGGLGFYTRQVPANHVEPRRQVLADAVAVAGMATVIRNRRRAVILILGRSPADSSLYDPDRVRSYLRALHVPLFVWTPFKNLEPSPWGEVEDISSTSKFRAAAKRLSEQVDRQRIIWIEGRHLPQDITLVPGVAATVAQ